MFLLLRRRFYVKNQSDHSLERNEVDEVLQVVNNNSYELYREYEYNRENGTDY